MIKDIYRMANDIAREHITFAGRKVWSSVWVYRKLMEAHDFINAEPAAVSVNYDAEVIYYDSTGQHTLKTLITVSNTDDSDKMDIVERAV